MPSQILDAPRIPHDFGFTDEHEAARAEARRFLEARSPITEVRRLVDDPRGYDPALFREMADLGWIGLTLPESLGGASMDSLHQALLLDEMGRVLLPSPYFASLLAIWAIERGGTDAQRASLLPAIVEGERVATLALSEPGASWDPEDVSATAEPSDGGFVLRGVKTHVLFGEAATLVVVPCREPGGVRLFVVELPSPGVTVEPETPLDTTRRMARLTLDGVRVAKSARLGGDRADERGADGDGTGALRAVHLRATAMLAAEMCGGIERTLGLTRDYATTRIQFGRPIGAFQAVKHPIVDMMIACESARSLALGAVVALERGPGPQVGPGALRGAEDGTRPRTRDDAGRLAEALARSAKAFASDAFVAAAKKGVQLHGGFGFTWDCDVHFYFKRAVWARGTLGDGIFHRRHLAGMLLGTGA